MSEEFKSKLRRGITEDSWLEKMKRTVEENNKHAVLQTAMQSNLELTLSIRGNSYRELGPNSFLEVIKLLPLLTNSDESSAVTFHVVVPSLAKVTTDYTKRKGFGLKQYAETCHKLMQKLGYHEYITQAGDWVIPISFPSQATVNSLGHSFHVTRTIGLLYPQHYKASHLNAFETKTPSLWEHPILAIQHFLTPYSTDERAGVEFTESNQQREIDYDILQQTEPQTLAYALLGSPVGLLAWIHEKLHG